MRDVPRQILICPLGMFAFGDCNLKYAFRRQVGAYWRPIPGSLQRNHDGIGSCSFAVGDSEITSSSFTDACSCVWRMRRSTRSVTPIVTQESATLKTGNIFR